ncbi:flagellar type III secretion system pore protein FliP [Psychrosphaera haliotis]|uniref:flagellar type III secretion system pore protein FliP n=1 Tax=Psychrosphaera haliotis TaxID=555083 RepID=UPI00236CB42F|nr:flagellar type III secretion system pore protein FliP [Psychrosphaera haliotis]
MKVFFSFLTVLLLVFTPDVLADGGVISAVTVTDNPDGSKEYSITLQVLAMMTALSFIPAIVMLMTSFTRIIVVLAILRQALGLQQTPNSQLLVGMSLFLSFFIMAPVFEEVHANAVKPYLNEEITSLQAYDIAKVPMREFMLAQTRISDLETFAEIAGYTQVDSPDDLPLTVIIPSFVTSELKTAFQIGFMFFIPFLIIDLVVASVLMAMGMMMLSPMIVSLPFKLMMFVLVDGWTLVMGTLAKSFGLGT